jgi:HrpA-like RNA helicase
VAVGEPRVVAARGLGQRVAAELQQPVGQSIGFCAGKERLLPKSDAGSVVYATYETLRKRLRHGARGLTHVIVDEVHERSVDIDLTLLLLREILRESQGCEFRVVLMSATLDVMQLRS